MKWVGNMKASIWQIDELDSTRDNNELKSLRALYENNLFLSCLILFSVSFATPIIISYFASSGVTRVQEAHAESKTLAPLPAITKN